MPLIIAAFLLTALLYASVGFGGGSTYTALLALVETDYRLIPLVALVCNLVVVTGGTVRYWRAAAIDHRRVWPIVLTSAPFAWAGGLMPIKQAAFMAVLGCSLAVAGLMLLVQQDGPANDPEGTPRRTGVFDLIAGGSTGFLAGVVGIGGGIFLAPLLHLTKWGRAQGIAAAASLFILVNSLAGLGGQIMKHAAGGGLPHGALDYWPLVLAVLVGGQIGTHAGLKLFSASTLRRATAVLILYVAATVLWKAAT